MNLSKLFIIAGLAIPGILTAQDSVVTKVAGTTGRHEINIGFVNLFQRQSFFDQYAWLYGYDADDFYELTLIQSLYGNNYPAQQYGAGYKYHFTKSAIRGYLEGNILNNSNRTQENLPNPVDYSEYSMKMENIGTRIGYEFFTGERNLKFFFGVDAIGQYQKTEFKSSSVNSYSQYPNQYYYSSETYSATKISYGIGTLLGLKYHFNSFLSVSTETRFDFMLFQQNGRIENVGSGSYSYSDQTLKSNGTNIKVSPLGLLSLNVHLK